VALVEKLAARDGRVAATRQLLTALLNFRDSTPSGAAHYGDAGYDWDHRVNTTSAAVGWRDRCWEFSIRRIKPTEAVYSTK